MVVGPKTFDFEAFYDDETTVRRLGNFNYFAATHAYLVSVVGDDIRYVGSPLEFDFARLSGGSTWSHNLGFDACFFFARGEPLPSAQWNCSSNLVAYLGAPRSLEGAAKHLLGREISKDIRKGMKGRRWADLSPDEQQEVRDYALQDSEIAHELVRRYAHLWPADEQELSRLTLEMGWRGVALDVTKLDEYIARAQEICAETLPQIPWRSEDPNEPDYPLSLKRAREYCQSIGIEPPESFNEKSAACRQWELAYGAQYPFIGITRRYRQALMMLRRLEGMKRRIMPNNGRMNYSLRYAGCHTLRWAGGDGVNVQNLRKADLAGIRVRSLITAAPGKKLIVVDLSSIEPRCLAYLAGDHLLLDLLRQGMNFYEAQARAWGFWNGAPGTLETDDPALYALLKALSLGAGYGMGAKRYRETVASQLGIDLSLAEAKRQLSIYRAHNPRVVQLWNKLDYALNMSVGSGTFRMELPSGRWLEYKNLVRTNGKVHCQLATEAGFRDSILWGGSLVENACQAFARDLFGHKLLALSRMGLLPILHSHDEYVFETDCDVPAEEIQRLIEEPVEWCPTLPIATKKWESECYVKR